MRFVCDSCRAQYMISDEKVGPKGVKVRCKKCSYVILVKKADGGSKSPVSSVGADADDALATQVMQNPLTNGPSDTTTDGASPFAGEEKTQAGAGGGFFSGVDEDEIGAVFDQVLSSGPHALPKEKKQAPAAAEPSALGDDPDDRLSTRVMDAAVVSKLATETSDGEAPIASGEAEAKPNGEAAPEWFAAIDDKQTGPLAIDKLKEHWTRGEIGPDSLAWKAGMPDWIPISEIPELASELSPRASKPVLVAPTPAVSAPGAVVSMPVESAFSAGGMSMSARGEVQVPLGTGEDVASWRPSAASALASLVKEEMDALSKPASAMAMEPALAGAGSGGGLLDLPPADDRPAPVAARTNGHSDSSAAGGSRGGAPANPYLATSAPTYSSPAIAQYRPPPPEKDNKMLFVVGGIGALIVILLGVGLIVSLNRQPVVAPVAQAPAQPVPTQPAPAQPAPTQPVVAQPPPAQPAPTQPAPAQPGTATAQQPAQVAPTPAQPVAPTPAQPTAPRPKAGSMGGLGGGEKTEKKSTKSDDKPAEAAPSSRGKKEDVDDFDAAFGGETKTKKTEKAPEKETQTDPKRSGYPIPPAPGQANIPETLQQSDIVSVVVENKPGLLKCVAEQKAKDPSVKGKLLMKWTISTSGKASNVSCVSEEFKSSAMAACMGALIKTMTFPKHKKQGEPITFPFTF
jgi:predicted Zn finger-like uncharacterized protein